MTKINYINGDIFTKLLEQHEKVVLCPHICNNINIIGGGFTFPLIQKWPQVTQEFHELSNRNKPLTLLGVNQFITVETNLVIVNMFAQDGVIGVYNKRPIVYSALATCMEQIAAFKKRKDFEIVAPFFGTGLAGGNKELISKLIEEIWCYEDIPVTIYYI